MQLVMDSWYKIKVYAWEEKILGKFLRASYAFCNSPNLSVYLSDLFCFKYLVANEFFFPNFYVIIQNQIKLPKLSDNIKKMIFIVLSCFYFLILKFEYQVSNQVVIDCNIPC